MSERYSLYIYKTDDFGGLNELDGFLVKEPHDTEEVVISHEYGKALSFKNFNNAAKIALELLCKYPEIKGIDIKWFEICCSWRCVEDIYYCECPIKSEYHNVAEISRERIVHILDEIKKYNGPVYIFNSTKRYCNILIGEKYYQITNETAFLLANRRKIPILNHEESQKLLAAALGHPEGIVIYKPSYYIKDGILTENIRERRHFTCSWDKNDAVSYVEAPQYFLFEDDEFGLIKVTVNLSGERKSPSYVLEHKKEIMNAGIQKLKEDRKFINSKRSIGMYAITNMTLLSTWKVMITFELKEKIKVLFQ